MNPYLILAAIVLVGASFGAGYYAGWQGKIADYKADKAEIDEGTRIDNEKVDKGHDIASKEIRKIPSGSCVGPRTGGASDWLSNNYRK